MTRSQRALQLFEESRRFHDAVDATFGTMVSAAAQCGRFDEVERWTVEMHAVGLLLPVLVRTCDGSAASRASRGCSLAAQSLAAVMDACERRRRGDFLVRWLRMVREKQSLDRMTLHAACLALLECNEADEALRCGAVAPSEPDADRPTQRRGSHAVAAHPLATQALCARRG